MANSQIKTRIIHKHDTEANWELAVNFTPKQGEIIIYDKDSTYNYERFKIGDGTTLVSALPFANDALKAEIQTLLNGKASTSSVTQLSNKVDGKVDKDGNKVLSTNDYTTAEKNKLAGIAAGAEVNQNAFSNVTVGSTTISADGETDTLTIVAGSNITLTPDATNDKITIAAKDTTYSNATTSAAGLMSADDKTKLNAAVNKLDGIEAGANKTVIDTALSSSSTNPVQNKVINSALSGKQATITGAATTITGSNLTASKALVSNSSGKVAASSVSSTELGYLSGVTGSVQTQIDELDANKVDKVDGKDLSSNDFTSDYITKINNATTKLSGIAEGANKTTVDSSLSSTSTNPVQNKVINSALSGKVDKVDGKGLSANDFTNTLKSKLDGIASGAQVNQNAFSNITDGTTTIAADSTTDTLTLAAGSNISLALDATNDKVTISATNTTYGAAGSSLGLVKSGGDVTISSGVITVNDDSHNHTIDNVDNLKNTLDAKISAGELTVTTSGSGNAITSASYDSDTRTITLNKGASYNNYTYTLPAAGSSLGGVKTGGDVTISSGVITVNDDSHNHVISNVDGLQNALDSKASKSDYETFKTNVNTLLDSDDETLDQMSEIVAYTKNNKGLIDSITTSKQDKITGAATTITGSNLTASRVLVSDSNGKVAASSSITTTELGYLDGVTSGIQNQLDGKLSKTGNAVSATKATQDANGNTISTYYMKRGSIERIEGTSSSYKDLNNYITAGFYNVRPEYVNNCPSGIGISAVLLVYEWNSTGYVCQEITESGSATTNRRWIRHLKDAASSWTSWNQVAFTTDNVASATKATQDASGNVITSTYATKTELGNKVDKVSGKGLSTNDFTTTLKNKLDGIAEGANNYSLPTASSTTKGGVKTGAAITDTTGYTAVHIKDGVIYYKDTNTNLVTSVFGRTGAVSLTKSDVTTALGYTPPTSNTTYSAATYGTLGLTKPAYSSTGAATLTTTAGSNSSTPTIAARTTTSGRYYAVETDKNGVLFVNVPWSNAVSSVAGKTGAVTLAKSDVGLGNVENKSSATIRGELTKDNVVTALGYTPPTSNTTYSNGSGLSLSGTTFSVNTSYTTSGKNYKVNVDSTTGGLYVNVPWTDTNTHAVTSVFGRTGAVTLTKDDVTTALGYTPPTTNTTYSLAKYNNLGLVKPAYSSTGAATLTTTAAENTSTPTIAAKTTTSGRYYAVEADKNGIMFVNVPWTNTHAVSSVAGKTGAVTLTNSDVGLGNVENKSSATIRGELTKANVTNALGYTPPTTNTTYTAGTGLSLSSGAFSVKTGYTTSGKNYKVQADSSGNLYVNVPWTDSTPVTSVFGRTGAVTLSKSDVTTALGYTPPTSNTTYSAATYSTLGLVKPAYTSTGAASLTTGAATNTTTPTIAAKTTTSGRYYAVEADKNGVLFVNVPWSDTNTHAVSSVAGKTGAVTLTKSDVGLGNVENKSSATIRGELTKANVTTALGYTPPTTDTNTHYTTRLYAGASGTAANAAATNPYLKITDDNTYRNQIRFVGSGATTVSSDANGNITISSTDTNTHAVTSVFGRTGAVTLTKSDVTTALGYTPPTTDTNTTYSTATSSALGLVKIGYTTSGKNYAVQLSNGQMYVNVPWTDNNTTYSAGNGLSLSSTTFSVSYGTSASALGTSSAGSATTVSRSDHVHALPALTSCTGTLSVAKGGTGITSHPQMLTDLGSTSTSSPFLTAPRPGITGTLSISHGGTGATSKSGARTNLGITSGTSLPSSASAGDIFFLYS